MEKNNNENVSNVKLTWRLRLQSLVNKYPERIQHILSAIVGLFFFFSLLSSGANGKISILLSLMVICLAEIAAWAICYIPKTNKAINRINFALDQAQELVGKYLTDEKDGLPKHLKAGLESKFAEVLQAFFKSHDCVFSELYTGYPRKYMETISGSVFNEMKGDGRKGFAIWAQEISLPTYSRIVKQLLDVATESVYSTTYCENSILLKEVQKDNGPVTGWWKQINTRRQEISDDLGREFLVSRIHVFGKKTEENKRAEYDYEEFLKLFRQHKDAKQNYCNFYAPEWATIWGYINPKEVDEERGIHTPEFFGEYIIFDNQVAVCYDMDFEQCTIFCGTIAEKLALPFTRTSQEQKLEYPLIYKDIRRDLCS